MTQHIEIEFKNLLTEEEFTRMKTFLNMDESLFVKQENHYFDTASFALKELGCALRTRYKEGCYELTLKQPHTEGLLETNQMLSHDDATAFLQKNVLIDGPVKNALQQLKIPLEELTYFGSLTTLRAEKEFNGGLIVLDHSFYLNQSDFEVEYEVENFEVGKSHFNHLLRELHIPIRKTDNKIRRFYLAKENHR